MGSVIFLTAGVFGRKIRLRGNRSIRERTNTGGGRKQTRQTTRVMLSRVNTASFFKGAFLEVRSAHFTLADISRSFAVFAAQDDTPRGAQNEGCPFL
jgi:hypothetical protein